MSRIKAKNAYLQSPTSMPGVFQSATDLSKVGSTIVIWLEENGGLTIEIKGRTAYIPSANVKIVELEPKLAIVEKSEKK